jgi:hypothetical protein
MEELVPFILGSLFGTQIWFATTGRPRAVASAAAVVLSGCIATLFSGEYHLSWFYSLFDIAQAALGLALGFLIASRRRCIRVEDARGTRR